MEKIYFNDEMKTGNAEIDFQHIKIIGFYNELIDILSTLDIVSVQSHMHILMDDMMKYTRYHFETEERILQEVNYPEFDHHKEEHDELIMELTELCFDLMKNELSFQEFTSFFKKWIISHILEDDMQYREFL